MKQLEEKNIPVILLLNKADIRKDTFGVIVVRPFGDQAQNPTLNRIKASTGMKTEGVFCTIIQDIHPCISGMDKSDQLMI